MTSRFSPEGVQELPSELLRAVIRERTHHLLEGAVQEAVHSGQPEKLHGVKTVEGLLRVWEERGLPLETDDLAWVRTLLRASEEHPQGSAGRAFDETDVQMVRALIRERRSIRFWDGRQVPRALLEDIVRAGQWAPCACDLQTLRVLILDDPEEAAQIKGEVSGAPAQLVVCQDTRPYEFYRRSVPERNRGLDCGAAMQNMVLMAHALGLGAVWLTFSDSQREKLRQRYQIPEHIDIVSYISVGWPAINPLPPGRMELEAILLGDRTSG